MAEVTETRGFVITLTEAEAVYLKRFFGKLSQVRVGEILGLDTLETDAVLTIHLTDIIYDQLEV